MAPIANLPALTETWNEATIAGTMEANLIDNYQQEHKRAIRERFSVDHFVVTNEAAQINVGAHKVIHMLTQGADPLALTDAGELYCKDVGGVAELFWQDENENIVQLTSGGLINAMNTAGDYTVTGLITFSQFPITPSAAPTTDYQVANKKYVDDMIVSNGIFSGFIGMYSGTIASIPATWALCDGTNGTPDLRDKFILGAGNLANPGDNKATSFFTLGGAGNAITYTGGGGPRVSGTGAMCVVTTYDHMPPYYALAFIMKL